MGSSDPPKSLVNWAEANGTLISQNLTFEPVLAGHFGAVYKGDEKNDDALNGNQIRLPIKLAITLQTAIKLLGDEFGAISEKTSNVNSVLKLYLCREMALAYINDSFHAAYLQSLPNLSQINSPYTWTAAEKALLKGSNLGSSLAENIALLVEEWWQVINLLPESYHPTTHYMNMKFYYEYKFYTEDDFHKYCVDDYSADNWTSFANYLWASLILKSRSFPAYLLKEAPGYDTVSIKTDEAMLLPVIDLLNHDPKAKVNWSVTSDGFFNFKSDSIVQNQQLFNNYGMKGNEELLLAYGFCLENNSADSAAMKLKISAEVIQSLRDFSIKLPTIDDYTTSVVRGGTSKPANDEDGLLFFVTETNLPESLVQTFQYIVKNDWETPISLRMKLHGLNELRRATEAKLKLLVAPKVTNEVTRNVNIYITSQQRILQATIKNIKRMEKTLLDENKSKLISLKTVYKKDVKLAQSLLLTFGFTSYEQILESQFQDQCWLVYLMRCYNRDKYLSKDAGEDGDEENFLPLWIKQYFDKLVESGTVTPQQIMDYKEIYENLVLPLNKAVPEIYDRGKWGVKELILGASLLDKIGFVRGKDFDCILVVPE